MTPPLSLPQVAAQVGLSASRFRHVWREWIRERCFPAPFTPPGAHPKWNAEDVEAWRRKRARALGTSGRHEAANDVHPADRLPLNPTIVIPAPSPALDHQRATMRALMAKGA